MIAKPLATISKFTGMTDEGGVYYLDGFSVVKENGLTSLDESYTVSEVVNSATSGYGDIANGITALTYLYPLSGSNLSVTSTYTLFSSASLFFTNQLTTGFNGKVGLSGDNSNGDIFNLPSGNILWTKTRYMGLIVRGLALTGSSTTKIVDSAGRNLTTLGLAGAKVRNLITGIEYTVTSITTTNSTDDTLNFTAVGSNANTANDEFLAFVPEKWDLNNTVTLPTFKGQPSTSYFQRPIRQFNVGDLAKYMILNGNYIAMLSNDESTIDQTFKQLPTGYQGITFEINSGYILVSAYDINGNSHLLYWDGFSDGWNEDTIIDRAPNSLKNYNSGWVYLSDSTIYYTDGKNITKLISGQDMVSIGAGLNSTSHNGIVILNDVIYFTVRGVTNRTRNGVLVFNKKYGLTFFKLKGLTLPYVTPYCIYAKTGVQISSNFSPDRDIEVGCENSLNNVNSYVAETSTLMYKSCVYLLDFGQETQVKQVWLNLKPISKKSTALNSSLVADITVNYGNGARGIIYDTQVAKVTGTNVIQINGTVAGRELPIGSEVEFIDGSFAGQRTHLVSIDGDGTSTENWTVSPLLVGTVPYNSSSNVRTWNVKKGEQRTVSIDSIDNPVVFNTNFKGSKMYLEILIKGNTDAFPVSIMDISIF